MPNAYCWPTMMRHCHDVTCIIVWRSSPFIQYSRCVCVQLVYADARKFPDGREVLFGGQVSVFERGVTS